MQCNYCEWRCELGAGKYGRCRMYHAPAGVVTERFPDKWCTYEVSRVESIPFYHVYPGSRCLSIGTSSCNFTCKYCSNAFIAKTDPQLMQEKMFDFSAARLVDMAKKLNCRSIIFNVNEPTVSIPSLLRLSEEARSAGIAMGCLTNGYSTPEATEQLASIFSFFNISLKGLSDEFNQRFIGIPSVKPVLENIARFAAVAHVEVTTPVVQGSNDHELDAIAAFIADIDPQIPWHVLRLLPEDEMRGEAYPDILKINDVLQQSRKVLPYIYFHNFVGSEWVNTNCPSCSTAVIERFSLGCGGDQLQGIDCPGGNCPSCGEEIRMLGGTSI